MEELHLTVYQIVLKVCPVLWITSNYGPSGSSSLCVKSRLRNGDSVFSIYEISVLPEGMDAESRKNGAFGKKFFG